ncbi:MAG: HD domain-containing protein, partial [Candidatus Diapherotrites archaeon]|nr:HD domain-containing protein [Candidatus Diapherotrites archaeon]
WVERGVEKAESVSDHSFRMTVMALALGKKLGCDVNKLVRLCIVHDLQESICGDLILDYSKYDFTAKGLSKEEKTKKETQAFEELKSMLGKKEAKEFEELWNEYEARETKEAKLAKELDILEMLLQAFEYEKAGNFKKPVWSVWLAEAEANQGIKNPVLRGIWGRIKEKAKEFEK